MPTILPDLRFALRQLRREPGFALVAILTLGVGTGATSVVFSVFYETLLRDLASNGPNRFARIAWVLLGSAGLLLLLACASVSSLLLARTVGRQRELALRATLGAFRPQIFRQLIVESVVLGITSGGIGVLFAAWVLPAIRNVEIDSLPQLQYGIQS